MDKQPSAKSFLLVCGQAISQDEITKIAKKFNISFPKTSPDTIEVWPEKKHVTIDQVRNLRASVYQKPVQNKFKLIIVYHSDTLTTEAQNALLKLLEEPPAHAVIILQAKNKDSLLPTILSRTDIVAPQLKIEQIDFDLFSDQKSVLEKIAEVEKSSEFLDGLIVSLFNVLLENSNFKNKTRIINAIESARDAKKMIEANVDPRFVLTNLVFSVN